MANEIVPSEPTPVQLPADLEYIRPAVEAFAKAAFHTEESYRLVRSQIRFIHEHIPAYGDLLASLLVVLGEYQEVMDEGCEDLVRWAREPAPVWYVTEPERKG